MAQRTQIVGHTTTVLADAFLGRERELSVDMEKDELRVHDGSLLGGYPLLRADWTNLPASVSMAGKTITNFQTTGIDDNATSLKLVLSDTDVQYNGNVMWHAGNDGPGSGLDADTVDGIQGADILVSADLGNSVQPYDADISAIAALTGTGFIVRTGVGTAATRSIEGTANEITVTNGDGVALNPVISIPATVTFTGKSINGGTFSGITLSGNVNGQPSFTGASVGFANSVSISGNLVVSGTLTADFIGAPIGGTESASFIINSDHIGPPTENAGIEVERGTSPNAKILFDETDDVWKQDPGTGTLEELGGVKVTDTVIGSAVAEIELNFGVPKLSHKHIRIIFDSIELANTVVANNIMNMQFYLDASASYLALRKSTFIEKRDLISGILDTYTEINDNNINFPVMPDFDTGNASGPYFNMIMDLIVRGPDAGTGGYVAAKWEIESIGLPDYPREVFYKGNMMTTVSSFATGADQTVSRVKFLMGTAVNFEGGRYQYLELS